jgi:ATP-binding cassette subfamily F protein uup
MADRRALLSCESISRVFGSRTIFAGLDFAIAEGDHVGLVGPNGAGKSTFLRILADLEPPDAGIRAARKGIRVGYVPQDPVFAPGRTVEEVVLETLVAEPTLDGYEREARAAVALGRAGFTERGQDTSTLSGGWRKRLAIAREMALEPEVLLLDEPTNHLDVEGILWLEKLLASEPKAFVAVSHDRYFLDNISRRMVEISAIHPGGIFEAVGSYSDFLEKRDEALRNLGAYRDSLANLVRREIEWLRRGPKARTTKAKARVDQAEAMIDELDQLDRRREAGSAGIDFTASGRKTRKLWECRGLSKSLGGRTLVSSLDLLLSPGSRIGVLGPNGSGKTTLLRTIIGELEPDSGTIDTADALRTVYFEQNRESLDPDLTLKRALAPEGDAVVYRDRSLHVAAWARRFLFRPEQLETKVSSLSGGEKARILLARLMLRPADLLVLDEPTNDLDIPTLDVLEESLLEFPGALVLVTHDRYLLERVSTRILALDGRGDAEFYADLDQWESHRDSMEGARGSGSALKEQPRTRAKRLTYLEQREWDEMEDRLFEAEAHLEECRRMAEDPAIATDAAELESRYARLKEAQAAVDSLYARWAELEAKIT